MPIGQRAPPHSGILLPFVGHRILNCSIRGGSPVAHAVSVPSGRGNFTNRVSPLPLKVSFPVRQSAIDISLFPIFPGPVSRTHFFMARFPFGESRSFAPILSQYSSISLLLTTPSITAYLVSIPDFEVIVPFHVLQDAIGKSFPANAGIVKSSPAQTTITLIISPITDRAAPRGSQTRLDNSYRPPKHQTRHRVIATGFKPTGSNGCFVVML